MSQCSISTEYLIILIILFVIKIIFLKKKNNVNLSDVTPHRPSMWRGATCSQIQREEVAIFKFKK